MTLKALLPVFILLTLTSCAPTQTITKGSYVRLPHDTQINSGQPGNAVDILVFYKKSPDFNFIDIGIVEAIAYGKDAGLNDLLPELKNQAAKAGSDAIYKIELQRYNQTGDALHATGIAIKKLH